MSRTSPSGPKRSQSPARKASPGPRKSPKLAPPRPTRATTGAAQSPPNALRRSVERVSSRPLTLLTRAPKWLMPLLLALVLIAGLAVSGIVGVVALAVVLAFVTWLVYLSWPVLTWNARLLRLVVISLLSAAVVVRIVDLASAA